MSRTGEVMRLATALTPATSILAGCAGEPPARSGNVLTGGSDYFGSAAAPALPNGHADGGATTHSTDDDVIRDIALVGVGGSAPDSVRYRYDRHDLTARRVVWEGATYVVGGHPARPAFPRPSAGMRSPSRRA